MKLNLEKTGKVAWTVPDCCSCLLQHVRRASTASANIPKNTSWLYKKLLLCNSKYYIYWLMITKPFYPRQFFISEMMWINDKQITNLSAGSWVSEQKDDATAHSSLPQMLCYQRPKFFFGVEGKKKMSKPQVFILSSLSFITLFTTKYFKEIFMSIRDDYL